ncbi:CGGC domain-containing protein [Fusibacter sp. JL298sf-3]
MKIAVMACRKLVNKCTGIGCYNAFHKKAHAFAPYVNEDVEMSCLFYCAGCAETVYDGEDWSHKVEQLKRNGVETVHLARCIEVECAQYHAHINRLEPHFKVVCGSHA